MVHSMLSPNPNKRPEAADITGMPLFQELELPCRLAVRQRSRTYSASSMGRPSRQTSTNWKSHLTTCDTHPTPTLWSATLQKPLGALPSRCTSDTITLNTKNSRCAGWHHALFTVVRHKSCTATFLSKYTCRYNLSPRLPILISLTNEGIF